MDHRRPAARHGNRVACDLFQYRAFASLGADFNASDALATLDGRNAVTHHNANAQSLGLRHQIAVIPCGTGIDDRWYIKACVFQRNRGAIGIVVVGDHNRAIARGHTVVHHIVADRRGKHNARNIVARKAKRAFNRASGCDGLRRTNAPQAVAWASHFWGMIRQAFIAQDITVIVNTRAHHTGADGDVVHSLKFSSDRGDEVLGRLTVNRATIHNRATAQMGGLLGHDDLGTRGSRRFSRLKTSDPATNDQDVTERIEVFVCIRVAVSRFGCSAKASRVADDWLVDVFPERPRVDEHFVIETSRHKAAKFRV